MDLINSTPVAAKLTVFAASDRPERRALLFCKATFRVDANGVPILDREDPLPVNDGDVETPLGVMPSDIRTTLDPAFEVMVLGRAHSPSGRPVEKMTVSLSVGGMTRRLLVTGDRIWHGQGPDASIGPARPFTQISLDWSRAFGGTVEVEVDDGALIDVSDQRNAAGRGFDHAADADALALVFDPPDGYPKYPDTRPLPNIEDVGKPVSRWEDAPAPVCWAPTPANSGMFGERLRRRLGSGVMSGQAELSPDDIDESLLYERAHPDWVIDTPAERARVSLEGMLPGGRTFSFRLPRARLTGEMRAGERTAAVEAHPRALVLLPEERRFYLVFCGGADFLYDPSETRVMRLTAERGWAPPVERAVTQVPR